MAGAGSAMDRALVASSRLEGQREAHAVNFERSRAARPIGDGLISEVLSARFGAPSYASGPSRVVPIDLLGAG